LCCFSMTAYCCKRIFCYWLSPETFGYTLIHQKNYVQVYIKGKLWWIIQIMESTLSSLEY